VGDFWLGRKQVWASLMFARHFKVCW